MTVYPPSIFTTPFPWVSVHNIDLAEKVPLSAGDSVDLAGELVYGDRKKDPILHFTHSDPQKKRIAG